ncbi:hypothetical protein [Sporosarcina luteola]|uniref:hypothetical protein n=1 Tax=Sporosarcina luteola TaxID=582850 RepID=UPI0020403240|nr:hypothetical protein [Sporosarcina luteola]MCM3711464.1 hypothetical protein [Sporosarcina luteola]
MKLNKYTLLLLAVYCIPFVFLSMYNDYKNYSIIVYGLMIIAVWYFASLAKRKSSFFVLLIANILSFLSSYFWVLRVNKVEEWEGYFKPFSSDKFLVFVTVLIVLLQGAVYLCTRPADYERKVKRTEK